MGRPSLGRERFNATLPTAKLSRADDYAAATGTTRSNVIEGALDAYLSRRWEESMAGAAGKAKPDKSKKK